MKKPAQERFTLAGYQDYCSGLSNGNLQCQLLLEQQDLFLRCCEPDPKTGAGYYCDLDTFLNRIATALQKPHTNDRLSWILQYSSEAVEYIMRNMHKSLSRIHTMQPVHRVNEVDLASLIWLSRQQGNSVKEKLKFKRQIYAPTRIWILDTAENRVFKAFIETLYDLFEAKQQSLGKKDGTFSELEQPILRWLSSDCASTINRWGSLKPNNRLLGDKNYRKIWDSWGWLRVLDDNLQEDASRIESFLIQSAFWAIASAIYKLDKATFLQIPCGFSMPKMEMYPQVSELNTQKHFWCLNGFLDRQKFELQLDKNTNHINFTLQKSKFEISSNQNGFEVKINSKENDTNTQTLLQGNRCLNNLLEKFNEFISCLVKTSIQIPSKSIIFEAKSCVIDIGTIRPTLNLIDDRPHQKQILPFNLIGQFWECNKYGRILLDCSQSKGFFLSKEHEILSGSDLFSGEKTDQELYDASQLFFNKLSHAINCKHFYYIAPDAVDEIAQYTVRSQINLYFSNAQSVPRSIGALFSMLSNKADTIKNYEQVLIICASISGTDLTITPLVGSKKKEVNKELPESGGMQWERFPSNLYNLNVSALKILPPKLKNKVSKVMNIEIGNIDALKRICLYYQDEELSEEWFVTASDVKKVHQDLKNVKLPFKKALEEIFAQIPDSDKLPKFFISADYDLNAKNLTDLNYLGSFSSVEGVAQLLAWQQKSNCPMLWQDHLPELYMRAVVNGIPEYFSLVQKNHTVVPQFGKTSSVDSCKFTLQPGKDSYSFPLSKKSLGSTLRYRMEIHSPTFPLKRAVPCTLKMEYTYGAEKPYRLFIIPEQESTSPFKKIEADWVKADTVIRNSPIPKLPKKKTWSYMKQYPDSKGSGHKDLVDWMIRSIQLATKVCDAYKTRNKIKSVVRICINDFCHKISYKEGRDFCHLNLKYCDSENPFGEEVAIFCHISEFSGKNMFSAQTVYMSVIKESKGYKAYDMTTNEKGETKSQERIKEIAERFRKSVSFPPIILWQEGRSLRDIDAPNELRDAIFNVSKCFETICNLNLKNSPFYTDFLNMVASMHKDIPLESMWNDLEKIIIEDVSRKNYKVNFAGKVLGDLSLPIQEKIHSYLLDKAAGWKLRALALAYWRCPEAILKLSVTELANLSRAVTDDLEKQIDEKYDKEENTRYQSITRDCELLLALLTTRESPDPEIRNVLDGNSELVERLNNMMVKLLDFYGKHRFKIKSYVKLNLKKPSQYEQLDDLLYAVYMYITGDNGANDIVITEIYSNDVD